MKYLIKDRKTLGFLFKQLDQFFSQYISTEEQMIKSLDAKFKPQLTAREQQLSQQLGTQVKLQASQLPEFAAMVKKSLSGLEAQYREIISQAKAEITRLAEESI